MGSVSPAMFAAHAAVIAASGRGPLTITDLAAALRGEVALPARPVAVTFDDGYSDTIAAVALLLGHGVVSTVYVSTGAIGCAGRMSREQVAALAQRRGVELGAHGVHHRRLDELDDDELDGEIRGSKLALEAVTGRPAQSFSYPHGSQISVCGMWSGLRATAPLVRSRTPSRTLETTRSRLLVGR